MKKQTILLILTILIVSTVLTGCYKNPPTDTGTPLPTEETVTIPPETVATPTATTAVKPNALLELLPKEEGYKWIYNGFAEYSHEMTLKLIAENIDTGNTVYDIKGMVEDVSDGESEKDYSIALRYIVDRDTITQEATGEMLMDSDFQSIQLIKLPLEKSSSWEQEVTRRDGTTISLSCTIEDISDEDGKKVYSILYQDTDSDYYEKRTLVEGVGVVAFEKLYTPDEGESFAIGYTLFK